MKAKEIVILTRMLGNAGAERILTELSNEWAKIENKATVVQTDIDDSSSSYVLNDKVT